MSQHAEPLAFAAACLLGMVAPADANHALYTAGVGACMGGLIISGLPTTKKLGIRARLGRWSVNAACGVCAGPFLGALVSDLVPQVPQQFSMLLSGCVGGATGVGLAILFWGILKRVLPAALKSLLSSLLSNVLRSINSSDAPPNPRDGK